MTFAQAYRSDTPVGSTTQLKTIDSIIKDEVKEAFRERLDVDHYFELSGVSMDDADQVGKHRKVEFNEVSGLASVVAGKGAIYIKTVSGREELFYRNNQSGEFQLTTNGKLNLTIAELSALVDNSTMEASGTLHIKDLGVTLAKLNSDVADGVTLQKTSGGLEVKDSGITETKLADNAVTVNKIGLPDMTGRGAEYAFVPIIATGVYYGHATVNRVVEVFGPTSGIRMMAVEIWGNDHMIKGIYHSSATCAWWENGAAVVGDFAWGLTGFTLTAGSPICLNDATKYWYKATGLWAQ